MNRLRSEPSMRKLGTELLIAVLLVALSLTAYRSVTRHDFIDLDDGAYVTANPDVQGGLTTHGLRWAWTTLHAGYWHPLTWMSLQLDAQLYGSHAGGYHATNLAWHIATVVLLFLTLRYLTGAVWRSAFVAALFAVHPQHVESVAWVAERKDVLSTFFWVLTLLAYGYYAERPHRSRYALVVLAFACGLLAKPMLVTLPCVLLLLDYWPLRRWPRAEDGTGSRFAPASAGRLVLEKLPLVAMLAAASLITLRAQRQVGAVLQFDDLPFSVRLGNALVSYVAYLAQTFWPSNLSVFYAYPLKGWPPQQVLGAGLLLAALTAGSARAARRYPYLLVGWLWFLGTLVPVIGLIQAGMQARADRFTYIPHIGLFLALTWGAGDLLRRVPAVARASLAMLILLGCLVLTARQVEHWRDSVTLWEHALRVDASNPRAHGNLGSLLLTRGDAEGAERHLERAVELDPTIPEYQLLLAFLRIDRNKLPEAEKQLIEFVRRMPNSPEAQFHLGIVRLLQGRLEEALPPLLLAERLSPGAIGQVNRAGLVQADKEKWPEAEHCFDAAVRLDPRAADYRFNLALALREQGRRDEADQEYAEGLRLAPEWPAAAGRIAWELATDGASSAQQGKAALRLARQACQATNDRDPFLLDVRAATEANVGRWDEAAATAAKAVALARSGGQLELAAAIEDRQRLYQKHQPYREKPGAVPRRHRADSGQAVW